MKETGGGAILNSSSFTSLIPGAGRAAYTASKAGINGFTKLAAGELAPYGIRVNSVLGGSIATAFQAGRSEAEMAQVASMVALHRIGMPDEISKAYVFLASDAASYITLR
jgi:3alpha(or 20beta)-hydroxysteroid dehydrogenase